MVKPDYDAVPLLIARRLLQAWAVTAGNEQLKQMLTLLQLRHGKADAMEELLAALLEGLNSGGICLVRIRRRSPSVAAKKPEFLPFVHRPVPLGPPAPLSQPGPAPGPVSLYTPALAQDEEFRAANVLNPSDQSIEDKVSALDEKSAKVVKIGGGIDSLLGKAYVRARGYRVHAKEMNSAVGVGIISDKKGNLSLSPASHRIPVDGVYANPNNHAPTVLDIDATKAIYILERAPHTFYQKGYYGRDYQWLSNAFEAIVIVETTASNELDFVSIYHPGASQPTEYPEGLN